MVAGSGCWQTRCCWWLCPGCATHPFVSSSYAAPFPSREKFPFCGNFHFPGKTCLCWHCTVPCNHLQTSYRTQLSRTCPEKMDGSQGPPAFCLQEKVSLYSGTLTPSGHPRFSWRCPHWVPALHAGCSGPIHVCTHMPLVCKIKPPTTWDKLGINLKTLPGLNWKKSRV